MNNKVYDILKWFSILFLPALSTFVACVFPIWNLPYGDEIAKTVTALAVFLGAILGVSTIRYNAKDKEEE